MKKKTSQKKFNLLFNSSLQINLFRNFSSRSEKLFVQCIIFVLDFHIFPQSFNEGRKVERHCYNIGCVKSIYLNSPSSYFDTSCVCCSFKRLFSSHNLVMTMSLSISKWATFSNDALVWGCGGSLGLSMIDDTEDNDGGDRLFCNWLFTSSVRCKLTYDWNDFVLFVCFKIGIELRRVGESAILLD